MRKTLWAVLTLILLLLCTTAYAEIFTFDTVHATCEVDQATYIILTQDNLAQHPDWIASMNTTAEALSADFVARGVLLQAWTKEADRCIEISAVRDERALTYWDINEVSENDRYVYRTSHSKNLWYQEEGYTYSSATWKRLDSGRFLQTEYKRTVDGVTTRGFQRRTVRNGYTITIDCIVYGRRLQTADSNAINKVMNHWTFTQITPQSSGAASLSTSDGTADGADSQTANTEAQTPLLTNPLSFTSEPPEETNTGKFTVSGTTDAGIDVVGVLMRISNSTPTQVTTTSSKSGKFSLDVELPTEGVWLMAVYAMVNGEEADSHVFSTITYNESLLIVNLDEPLPTELTSDKLVISGKTLSGVTIQCLAGGSYDKSVKTSSNGTFKFTIDTSSEGTYNIVLNFQKAKYDMRRLTTTATRTLTEEERRERIREEAVKPAYTNLVNKLTGYTGKTVTYSMYVTDILPAGDEWIMMMAMKYSTKNGYSEYVVVQTDEEPQLEIGSEHRLYGTCLGTYEVQREEGVKYYPCIELLFWDD